uniref:5-hydroxytryptamine receptor 2B n=1 Tax=Ascaris suum TaxID=6253 RepID=F1KX22_ASCSU
MSEWQFTHVRVPVATRQTSNVLALLLLPLLCAVGLLGNLLVCMAIWFDRRLHNVTNYFLFSLALADLFVCSIVMPLSLLVEVRHGVWTWSFSVCLLYVYADVFLCTASIVHMSMISLDRFLGISRPLKFRNRSRTMTTLKITFVWLITILISCPIAIAALIDPTNILQRNSCAISNRYYMVYGSTFAFLIPFIVMAVTYTKTTTLLKKQASQLSQRASNRSNGLRRTLPHRRLGQSSMSNGMLHKNSVNIGGYSSLRGTHPPLLIEDELQLTALPSDSKNKEERGKLRRIGARTSSAIFAVTSRISRKSSLLITSQDLANEHKATRVLAVVFGCFFVCWTPFFAANFAVGFCGESCAVPPGIASLFLWLGYVSSTINPLIYTIFNRRFRQAFLRIIRCQCLRPWRELSSMNYSRNYTYYPGDTYTWSNVERTAKMGGVCKFGEYWSNVSCRSRNEFVLTDRRQLDNVKTTSESRPLLCGKHCNSSSGNSLQNNSARDQHDDISLNTLPANHSKYTDNDNKYLTINERSETVSKEVLVGSRTSICCMQMPQSTSDVTSSLGSFCSGNNNSPCSPTALFASTMFAESMHETFL